MPAPGAWPALTLPDPEIGFKPFKKGLVKNFPLPS
jgi:hypothetical protein